MVHLRLVGDVHGEYAAYKKLLTNTRYSIQLGDMGFDYTSITNVNPDQHKFLPGNHEGYHKEYQEGVLPTEVDADPFYEIVGEQVYRYTRLPPNFLGHYGVWKVPDTQPGKLSGDIFFVRGANSIDRRYRTFGVDWFHEEQLSFNQFNDAIQLYEDTKPDFVISHDCPEMWLPDLINHDWGHMEHTMTNAGLQRMWDAHEPRLWVFAHHHRTWHQRRGNTLFICLNILSTLDFNEKLEIVHYTR